METGHLKAFLRITETGSISRAAESLGIAQPSLSQQLLRLEDEVGIQLFNRTARGVTLTEAGRVFQGHARQVVHAAEQAIADTRHLRADAHGQVVFLMPPSIARLIGVRVVETLMDSAPHVRARMVESYSGSTRGWLEADKIDLGMVYDLGGLRQLSLRPIASEELVLLGPANRFGSIEAPTDVAFADLAEMPLIAPGPQHGLRQVLDREAARVGIELTVAQEIDSPEITTGLVAAGHGLAVLPHCAAAEAMSSGWFSLARLSGGTVRRRLSLARNPSHVLTHASIRVEAVTLQVLARLIAEGLWQGCMENS
jgi:LysR family nitrogen assimilation transcriptional regulator